MHQSELIYYQKTEGLDDRIGVSLSGNMPLFLKCSDHEKKVIIDFIRNFYSDKDVLVHPDLDTDFDILNMVAANVALVGAAQKTNYFSCVKWLYLCKGDLPEIDGSATGYSTVRIDCDIAREEISELSPGNNVVIHEFTHILDQLLGISGTDPRLRAAYQEYLENLDAGTEALFSGGMHSFHEDYDSMLPVELNIVGHSEEEFLAYAAEAFFSIPDLLKTNYPQVFDFFVDVFGLSFSNKGINDQYQLNNID